MGVLVACGGDAPGAEVSAAGTGGSSGGASAGAGGSTAGGGGASSGAGGASAGGGGASSGAGGSTAGGGGASSGAGGASAGGGGASAGAGGSTAGGGGAPAGAGGSTAGGGGASAGAGGSTAGGGGASAGAGGSTGTSEPVYPVYAGCEAPATTFTRTLYVDPQSGADGGDGSEQKPYKTLAAVVAGKRVQPGDHVVLRPGHHGSVQANEYKNPELVDAAAWIWIEFEPGATAERMALRRMSRWLITGAEITSEKETLVALEGSSQLVFADARLYTVKDSSGWTASDWMNVAASGVWVRNGTCTSVIRNRLSNLRFGISIGSDEKNPDDGRMRVLVERNDIRGFSADGIRPNGNDLLIRYNRVLDVMVGDEDGDANHDDLMQMFAMNGATFDNIRIESNWVQETTAPGRPLSTTTQGISVFDGIITRLQIIDNVVLCGHWHGISGYGIVDGTIRRNTVQNSSTNGRKIWIMVPKSKNDGAPTGDVVQDNIAASYPDPQPGVTYTGNVTITDPEAMFVTFDRATGLFDLHAKPGSDLDGKAVGSSLKTIGDPRLLAP